MIASLKNPWSNHPKMCQIWRNFFTSWPYQMNLMNCKNAFFHKSFWHSVQKPPVVQISNSIGNINQSVFSSMCIQYILVCKACKETSNSKYHMVNLLTQILNMPVPAQWVRQGDHNRFTSQSIVNLQQRRRLSTI